MENLSQAARHPSGSGEYTSDYLRTVGWYRSVQLNESVDAQGPVPWFTYPAIRFLQGIVRPDLRVLEYGTGNSTLWWAQRVQQVVSVEHDPAWAARVRKAALPNVELREVTMDAPLDYTRFEILRQGFFAAGHDGGATADPLRNYRAGLLNAGYIAYAAVALAFSPGHFDVIVVDGMARSLTAWIAARQVHPNGIVVFDNADRHEYQHGYDALTAAGFRRFDFWGAGPINSYEWCTSVFLRSLQQFQR
jgi:hypothetical protein